MGESVLMEEIIKVRDELKKTDKEAQAWHDKYEASQSRLVKERAKAEARIEKYADFLRLKDRNYERLEARLVAAEQRHIEPMAGCSCSACTQLRERGRS